jgi:hypothetical protein
MALEQGQQGQQPGRSPGVLGDKLLLLVAWAIKRLEFMGGQGRFEPWIGGAIDRSHSGKVPIKGVRKRVRRMRQISPVKNNN